MFVRDIYRQMSSFSSKVGAEGDSGMQVDEVPLPMVNQMKHDQPGKATQHKRQMVDPSGKDMNDLWEPLNALVEAGVTLGKSNKSKSSLEPEPEPEPEPCPNLSPTRFLEDKDVDEYDEEDEDLVPPEPIKQSYVNKSKIQKVAKKSNPTTPPASTSGNPKKARRGRKKKETILTSNGIVAEGKSSKHIEIGTNPIWFTLVASDKQEGPSPLPQIPNRYVKIKDAQMRVSFIKTYLARKLNLQSEDEVEIRILGIPIFPALPMQRLVELWIRAGPGSEKKGSVGASAKDFVLVLTYARNHRAQTT